jgi:hypothetical protein
MEYYAALNWDCIHLFFVLKTNHCRTSYITEKLSFTDQIIFACVAIVCCWPSRRLEACCSSDRTASSPTATRAGQSSRHARLLLRLTQRKLSFLGRTQPLRTIVWHTIDRNTGKGPSAFGGRFDIAGVARIKTPGIRVAEFVALGAPQPCYAARPHRSGGRLL